MDTRYFDTAISHQIWEQKYRYREGDVIHDQTVQDSWRRVARALASVEAADREVWEDRFYNLLEGFKFLPGGRILAGAGTGRRVTLFNCFVMGLIEDCMDGIFDALKEGALTMQQGGGVGYDFSTLRPAGTLARSVGGIASGPVSFMRIWDSMCGTLLSTGARRGAMMATLRCDHPDIESFIDAKRDGRELRNFNLSVLVTDGFMKAIRADDDWPLVFPAQHLDDPLPEGEPQHTLARAWSGSTREIPCRVLRTVRARVLWDRIMRATYEYAEPGVLFIDRINQQNNLRYREVISATNPCGEIPLPPYGACNLGSVNLSRFVIDPFAPGARLDTPQIERTVEVAVRMLDNVIDLSRFPLDKQREQARGSRRIGLGITGLADALIMLGARYGEDDSYHLAGSVMKTVCHTAYRTSVTLARDKGVFPYFDSERFVEGPFIQALPEQLRLDIARYGLRNSHLLAIAPTGTISVLADNVSSGLEPVVDFRFTRRILGDDGRHSRYQVDDYAWRSWRATHGDEALPPEFVSVRSLSPAAHLQMQAAIQPYVDNAISKTINVPADLDFSAFRSLYEKAYDLGLKGCTTFRPNAVTGEILSVDEIEGHGPHCCSMEREAD